MSNIYYRNHRFKKANIANAIYQISQPHKMVMASQSQHFRKWKSSYRPSTKPSLQNQVDVLKRKVSRNTPETQYFQDLTSELIIGNVNQSFEVNVTDSLINTANFRDLVTGDKWINKSLQFHFDPHHNTGMCRLVIYQPKKVGQRFQPVGTTAAYERYPDPSAFRVFYDHSWEPTRDNELRKKGSINLGNMMTTYNSDSSTLERGEIIVMFMVINADASRVNMALNLAYQNK